MRYTTLLLCFAAFCSLAAARPALRTERTAAGSDDVQCPPGYSFGQCKQLELPQRVTPAV